MSDLAERFRREGMADAVVILVATRTHPQTHPLDGAEDRGQAAGIMSAMLRRYRYLRRFGHGSRRAWMLARIWSR